MTEPLALSWGGVPGWLAVPRWLTLISLSYRRVTGANSRAVSAGDQKGVEKSGRFCGTFKELTHWRFTRLLSGNCVYSGRWPALRQLCV